MADGRGIGVYVFPWFHRVVLYGEWDSTVFYFISHRLLFGLIGVGVWLTQDAGRSPTAGRNAHSPCPLRMSPVGRRYGRHRGYVHAHARGDRDHGAHGDQDDANYQSPNDSLHHAPIMGGNDASASTY